MSPAEQAIGFVLGVLLLAILATGLWGRAWTCLRAFCLGCIAFFLAINVLYIGAVLVAGNPAKLGSTYVGMFGSMYQGFVHGWESECFDWYTCEK